MTCNWCRNHGWRNVLVFVHTHVRPVSVGVCAHFKAMPMPNRVVNVCVLDAQQLRLATDERLYYSVAAVLLRDAVESSIRAMYFYAWRYWLLLNSNCISNSCLLNILKYVNNSNSYYYTNCSLDNNKIDRRVGTASNLFLCYVHKVSGINFWIILALKI